MKQKHGEDFKLPKKSERKPLDLLEKGRAKKREAINRAQDEESLEEIKEFVHKENKYSDAIISTGLIDVYEDDYDPQRIDYKKYV